MSVIPEDLVRHSISDREIVLPYEQALLAVNHLESVVVVILSWEGWIKHPDGRVGHSVEHQGTVCFERREGASEEESVRESAEFARSTIMKSQSEWEAKPEVEGGVLYFCITPDE